MVKNNMFFIAIKRILNVYYWDV